MQNSVNKKGLSIIMASCFYSCALFYGSTASAEQSLLFVSDFYQENIDSVGSCRGSGSTRDIVYGDAPYDISNMLNSISGVDILATEVNNCSYAGNSRDEYEDYIKPVWDSYKNRTHAVPGNHDYMDDAIGFEWYFGSETYHSFTKTEGSTTWKMIGLDSNLTGMDMYFQKMWLLQELQNEDCTIAYMHHPRWSSGIHGSNSSGDIGGIWNILADGGAEALLSGHDHDYERFWDMDRWGNVDTANGMVQLVAGTGGAALRSFGSTENNSVVRIANKHGYLRFWLYDGWYLGAFYDKDGVIQDYFFRSCH